MRNIAVVGSINADLVVCSQCIPRPGETLSANGFTIGAGGKGLNQAIACYRLAVNRGTDGYNQTEVAVQLHAAIGKDIFGDMVMEEIDQDGFSTEHIEVREMESTGVAMIMVEKSSGENRILLSSGANSKTARDFVANLATNPPDLIIMQLEIDHDTVFEIIREAAKQKPPIPVLLNPAPARILPNTVLPLIHLLVVNETEAAIICGLGRVDLEDLELIVKLAEQILEKGVETTVITLGARGCFYASKEGARGYEPALNVRVVDTTAAGDTFIGALGVALMTHPRPFEIQKAVRWATKCSAATVCKAGALKSIPWAWEID